MPPKKGNKKATPKKNTPALPSKQKLPMDQPESIDIENNQPIKSTPHAVEKDDEFVSDINDS